MKNIPIYIICGLLLSATVTAAVIKIGNDGSNDWLLINDLIHASDGKQYALTKAGLQSAIEAVGNNGYVELPPESEIEVSSRVYINYSNFELRGNGNSVIKMANNADITWGCLMMYYARHNVTISNIVIDGNEAQQTTGGVGIFLARVKDVLVKDCIIKDCYAQGIRVYDNTIISERVTIQNCRFVNCRDSGVSIIRTNGFIVEGCTFLNNGDRDVMNSGDVYVATDCNHGTIANNVFKDNKAYTVGGYNYASIHLRSCDNSSVMGNVIENPANIGILLYDSLRCSIMSNTVDNPGRQGIYLDVSPNGYIVGNSIYSAGQSGLNLGALAGTSSNYSIVADNVIEGSSLNGIISDADNCSFIGNMVHNCFVDDYHAYQQKNAGICVYGNHNIIHDNFIIDDNSTTRHYYGISDRNSAGNIGQNNSYHDNKIIGVVHDYIDTAGSGHSEVDNVEG